MKRLTKKAKVMLLLLLVVVTTSGCTQYLENDKNEPVKNEVTGQNVAENIICKPTDKEMIKIYEENGMDLKDVPECDEFTLTSGGYEGLWDSIFIKPLSLLLITVGELVKNYGLSIILVSLLIRILAFPLTRKTALQSELIKKAKPELDKLEKKYPNKNNQDEQMKKTQEMMAIYKKHKINPLAGCLFALIQLPLFIAFLEAIQRTPALFEDKLLGLQLGTTPAVGITSSVWYIYLLLIIIIGVTTYFSMKLNTTNASSDVNLKMMPTIMTIMIIITGIFMPAGLGLYWVTSNAFTVAQNLLVKRSKEVNGKK